jgi:membrane protease subunit HflK
MIKIRLKIILPLIIMLYFISGIYIVRPDEVAIVRLFGRIVEERVQPGIHYTLPWPFQKVNKPKIAEIKSINVGDGKADKKKDGAASYVIQTITGDTNIVNIRMTVQFTIKDPVKFIFRVEDPVIMLSKAAEAELSMIIGSMPVDESLTTGKTAIQNEVRIKIQELMDKYGTGVHIIAANLQSIEPPENVIASFKDVSSARADKERIISEAQSYANNVLPMARGESEEILRKAESYKVERVNSAAGEANSFLNVLKEYNKAKDATETRLYIETMEKILPNIKKYLVEGKGSPDSTRFIFSE